MSCSRKHNSVRVESHSSAADDTRNATMRIMTRDPIKQHRSMNYLKFNSMHRNDSTIRQSSWTLIWVDEKWRKLCSSNWFHWLQLSSHAKRCQFSSNSFSHFHNRNCIAKGEEIQTRDLLLLFQLVAFDLQLIDVVHKRPFTSSVRSLINFSTIFSPFTLFKSFCVALSLFLPFLHTRKALLILTCNRIAGLRRRRGEALNWMATGAKKSLFN